MVVPTAVFMGCEGALTVGSAGLTAPVCPETRNLGKVGVMSGNTSKRYPAELKQRAVRMYAEVRADHDTDGAAMGKVSELLGVGRFMSRGMGRLDRAGRGWR